MSYDPKGFQHVGDDLSLFVYEPVSSYGKTETNKLILAFKDNLTPAVEDITDTIIQFFSRHETRFRDRERVRYLVTIPSHRAECCNSSCEQVCSALAQRYAWLTHIPDALVRVETVPQSHRVSYDERPRYSRHMQTIQYAGPALHIPNESFMMLDDIITFGRTSQACRNILKRETGCQRVMGLFVGRTVGH